MVKNPKSNSVIERIHLTTGDMLRTTIFEGKNWPQELDVALQLVAWKIRSTINTMSGYAHGQLIIPET